MKRPEGFDSRKPEPARTARMRTPPPQAQPTTVRPATVRPTTVQPTTVQPTRPTPAGRKADRHATLGRRARHPEEKRFTRARRRRRLAWTISGSLVLLLVGVLAVAVYSPILALRTIRVEGTSALSASAVRTALSSQLGTPLALVSDSTIRRQLSGFVLIRSYVTEVVPPSTIVVRIVERRPIGVLKVSDGYEQVDPAGVILSTSATPSGLPVIDIGSARIGSPAFAAAAQVLLAMPQAVFDEVGTISARSLDNVSLTLTTGNRTVLWGSAAQSTLKARSLARMLEIGRCKHEPIFDVTAPLVLSCGPAAATSPPTPTPTTSP